MGRKSIQEIFDDFTKCKSKCDIRDYYEEYLYEDTRFNESGVSSPFQSGQKINLALFWNMRPPPLHFFRPALIEGVALAVMESGCARDLYL